MPKKFRKIREVGRPIKFSPLVVKKLEEAFSLDASIEEACFYAGISRQTYYNNVKEGDDLFDRFNELRQSPVLIARKTTVKALKDPDHAHWYLERKRKNEFSTKTSLDDDDGKNVIKPLADAIKSLAEKK